MEFFTASGGSLSPSFPEKTTSPPARPASGPMSISRSAARMISSSCSTTITVLPMSRRRLRTPISFSVSRGCRPMLGSSSMYIEPTRLEPSAVTRLMRWLSPPESVLQARLSVRYDSPTSRMHSRRDTISARGSAATSLSEGLSCRSRKNARASSTFIESSSWMFFPPTRTQRASLRRRLPPQARHSVRPLKRLSMYLYCIL